MNRNLDGCYFRVKRGQKFENICFSDLTREEQTDVLNGKPNTFIESMCLHLASKLKEIGDTFDIVCEEE